LGFCFCLSAIMGVRCIMPRRKADSARYRFWVGLDNQPDVAERIIKWSTRAGLDYPADFLKMLIKFYGLSLAEKMGVADEIDRKEISKLLTR
jgi:hypothetical protein